MMTSLSLNVSYCFSETFSTSRQTHRRRRWLHVTYHVTCHVTLEITLESSLNLTECHEKSHLKKLDTVRSYTRTLQKRSLVHKLEVGRGDGTTLLSRFGDGFLVAIGKRMMFFFQMIFFNNLFVFSALKMMSASMTKSFGMLL